MALEQLKRELELFGEQNDGAQQSRGSKMLNITRDTGELLAVLVQTRGTDAVLEIGTSNGYSTLWLAEAVKRLGAGSPPSSWTRANGPWRPPTLSGPGSHPGLSSWRAKQARCCPPCRRPLTRSSSSTQIASITRPGGQRSSACWPPRSAGGGQCHLPSRGAGRVDGTGGAGSGLRDLAGVGGQGEWLVVRL